MTLKRNNSYHVSHFTINNSNINSRGNNNTQSTNQNSIMPSMIQRTPFRSTKRRPWMPFQEASKPPPPPQQQQQQRALSSSLLPRRPDMIKRSTSLPTKLENAPPTKKLFWFRPSSTLYQQQQQPHEKENRLDGSPVIVQSFPKVESSRDMPLLPTLEDVSETTCNSVEELEELVGLGFLNE